MIRRLCLALLTGVVCASALAAPDPTYVALRSTKPDGRTVAVSNFVYERDAFRFTLNGKLHLLAPVDGKTMGAVFIGQGTYQLKPVTAAEQRQLAIDAAEDSLVTLTDTFDSAVFLGAALPAMAAQASAPVAGAVDSNAVDRWNDYMKHQRKDLRRWDDRANKQIRLLQDMMNPAAEPYFGAWLNGKKYPPAMLEIDPLQVEETTMTAVSDIKGGYWYSSRYRTEVQKGLAPAKKPLVDAEDYLIDSKIAGTKLDGTTTMTFAVNSDLRVLPVSLMGKLRISDAQFSPAGDEVQWSPLPFVQEDKDEDSDAALVFPSTLKQNEMYMVKLAYAGPDALTDAGDGNYTVLARTSWYPNVAVFEDLANYELHFHVPQKMTVVSVGTQTEDKVEGDQRVSVWKTAEPVRVAGFNYGKFKKFAQADKQSGVNVAVYTNPGTPDIIRTINGLLSGAGSDDSEDMMEMVASTGGGPSVHVDTTTLAQSAIADAVNTARTANEYFGPLTVKNVAITQQSQWFFGQSWPSLIYLPYLSFVDSTTRNTLGLNQAKDFVDNVCAHEFAHQWWGHQVGHKTYRDQWLDEGFAEFTAALVAQQTRGWPAYNRFMENARKRILETPAGAAISNDQAGPITQGYRLSTWRNQDAYSALAYAKGAYVLHMLRMAMWDPKKGDDPFKAMMHDYVVSWSGKNPSTLDFQRIAEDHIPPSLKITTDGKLDWFFQQWVWGTAIPKLSATFDFKDEGGGKYKVTGSLVQSQVPQNFATVVPMYVQLDKKTTVRFGSTMILGSTTKPLDFEITLPKKPMKFSINENHDILTR